MTVEEKKSKKAICLNVTESLSVNVIPNPQYEFLMDTQEVAKGYGVSYGNVREHKRVNDEFVEGKHFISAVRISDTDPHNKVYWTKRGIVRLGFFIKSERARLFRDWAEEVIIKFNEQLNLLGEVVTPKALPSKRKHNRLTTDRLLDIMADVCQIEDSELRNRIANKLKGGQNDN